MLQNRSVEAEKLLSMMMMKLRSPSSTKNFRISVTGAAWSLMLTENVMCGSAAKEVSVWINKAMEIGCELPLLIRRKL